MNNQEPKFLVNDFLVKSQEELEKVIKEIQRKPIPYETKAKFLKEFTLNLCKAQIKKKRQKAQTKQDLKTELEKRKQELLKKLQGIKG